MKIFLMHIKNMGVYNYKLIWFMSLKLHYKQHRWRKSSEFGVKMQVPNPEQIKTKVCTHDKKTIHYYLNKLQNSTVIKS